MGKRIISVIVSILITVITPFTVFAYDNNTLDGIKESIEGIIAYKTKALNAFSTDGLLDALSENAGTYSSDWYFIALSQYGINCENKKTVNKLLNVADDFYKEETENVKATDLQRVALTLSVCGKDITDINGHNLLADASYNREKYRPLDSQGVNSLAYALILLDSKNYNVPKNAKLKRKNIINKILSYELKNGGYALFGNSADVDITSIVLQSLSPYKNDSNVKKSVNKCLNILCNRQDSSGAFKSFDNKITAESTAQVIIALTSLNINPFYDKRFIKNGNTALDGLNLFKNDDGGYCHMTGLSTNAIATYQSLCSLVSVYKYLSGRGYLYNFSLKEKNRNDIVEKIIKKENKNLTPTKNYTLNNSKTKKHSNVVKRSKNSDTLLGNNSYKENKKTANTITEKSVIKKVKSKAKIKTKTHSSSQRKEVISKKSDKIKTFRLNKTKRNNKYKPERKPLYFTASILLSLYIIIFYLKTGGKK